MKAACPSCGAHGSIEMFLVDAEARECVALAARLPADLGPTVIRYISLFRPHKRGLQWTKARKLLGDLVAMIDAGQVTHYGRAYPASPALFLHAMTQMLNTPSLSLPLTSHGYLVKIIAGESPKEAGAAEAAAEELKRVASSQRSGSRSMAIAELSSEIGRRKAMKLPEMTPDERRDFMRERGFDE